MPRKIGSARPDKQDVLSDVLAVKHTLLEVKYGGGEGRGPEGGGGQLGAPSSIVMFSQVFHFQPLYILC